MERDLNEVWVFIRVVDEGSFTAAARALGLPKSTVSRRVSRLEDRLGVRLLQRTTRKLSLTDAGRAYYERGARAVADLEAAERVVVEMQATPTGTLRITAPVDLGHALGPILADFLGAYPEVKLDADFTNRYVDLVQEGYDLAIRAGTLSDSTLIAKKLVVANLTLVASPAYLKAHGEPQRIEELRDHECVIFAPFASNAHWRLVGPRGETSVPIRGRIATNNFPAVRAAALAGFGVAQLPTSYVRKDIESGTLRVVLPDACPPAGALWVVYPSTRHLAPKTRAFVDWLKKSLSEGAFGDAIAEDN